MSTANYVNGKVIVITGAGGGFGRLIATMTAELGASVVVSDVDFEAAQETADLIDKAGGESEAVAADVTVKEQMDSLAARTVERFGAIDVLVNNAGVMPLALFADHEMAWPAWNRAIDINFKGVVNGITAVYDQMITQGHGHIVNISSIYANQGTAGSAVYSATKAAVITLSDALRVEAQGKIKVTVVRPTGVLGTGLGATVINPKASIGLIGQNMTQFGERIQAYMQGTMSDSQRDIDDIRYWTLDAEDLAAQVVAVMNVPWGVNISDVTVRASGEDYIN